MTGGVAKAAVCPMTMSANTGDHNYDNFDVNELSNDDDFVADNDLAMMLC